MLDCYTTPFLVTKKSFENCWFLVVHKKKSFCASKYRVIFALVIRTTTGRWFSKKCDIFNSLRGTVPGGVVVGIPENLLVFVLARILPPSPFRPEQTDEADPQKSSKYFSSPNSYVRYYITDIFYLKMIMGFRGEFSEKLMRRKSWNFFE